MTLPSRPCQQEVGERGIWAVLSPKQVPGKVAGTPGSCPTDKTGGLSVDGAQKTGVRELRGGTLGSVSSRSGQREEIHTDQALGSGHSLT